MREAPQKPSYQGVIAADEEAVLRSIAAITAGVTGIVDKVQTLLVYWEKKYKSIWDQDKDAYMRCDSAKDSTGENPVEMYCRTCMLLAHRRYEKAQKPLAAFESDMTRYMDSAEEILAENAGEAVRFLYVDCGPLKQVHAIPRLPALLPCPKKGVLGTLLIMVILRVRRWLATVMPGRQSSRGFFTPRQGVSWPTCTIISSAA